MPLHGLKPFLGDMTLDESFLLLTKAQNQDKKIDSKITGTGESLQTVIDSEGRQG